MRLSWSELLTMAGAGVIWRADGCYGVPVWPLLGAEKIMPKISLSGALERVSRTGYNNN